MCIKLSQENPLQAEYAEEYFNSFENYRTNLVTVIAYLIGVPTETITNTTVFDEETYNDIKDDVDAKIIRSLCILRNQIFIHYSELTNLRKEFILLDKMTDYLDEDSIKFLKRNDIDISNVNSSNVTYNLAYINQFVVDRIDKIKKFVPKWVKFEYIRALFLISGGYSGHRGELLKGKNQQTILKKIHEVRGSYLHQKSWYPYQMFVMWPRPFNENDGNVLFNDAKFLKMLYGANKDLFAACEYVIDAEQYEKDSIYEFIDEAYNVEVFVDCENVDPFCFAATIANLDSVSISKVKKIILYDDVNTSTAWDDIAEIIDVPVEKHDISRLLDQKSLVDITMTMGVCQEHYTANMDSAILVSSDSDFWALIRNLPKVRFLVLNQSEKTSRAVIDKMDEHSIKHCFMDKFAQDKVQDFKNRVLYRGLFKRMDHFNKTGEFLPLSVDDLIRDIFYDANITGSEFQIKKEKTDFFNMYIKNGFLVEPVEENGHLVFRMTLNRK